MKSDTKCKKFLSRVHFTVLIFELNSQSNTTPPFHAPEVMWLVGWNSVLLGSEPLCASHLQSQECVNERQSFSLEQTHRVDSKRAAWTTSVLDYNRGLYFFLSFLCETGD